MHSVPLGEGALLGLKGIENDQRLLSADEERDVAAKAARGDTAAMQRLVLCYRPLVISYANRYAKRGTSQWDDLFQAGCIGLIDAAERFDSERGTRFSTYARWWVRYRVSKMYGRSSRIVVAATRDIRRMRNRGSDTLRRLAQKLGRAPTRQEFARELGVSPKNVDKHYAYLTVDDAEYEDERPVGHEGPQSPESHVVEKMMCERMERAMSCLSTRERRVINEIFFNDNTLRGTGALIGVSGERVRQIRERALDKLWLQMET